MIIILAAIIGAAAAWHLKPEPELPKGINIVYRDRPIVKKDTITREIPVTRIIYKTITKFDTITIIKPVGMNTYRLITPSPLRFRGRNAILSYYNPDSLRWQQDIYSNQRKWFYGGRLFVAYGKENIDTWNIFGGSRFWWGYKRISIFGELSIAGWDATGRIMTGLQYDFFHE
jgi:hypothetical protein